jgi:hypothetical protein
MALPSGSSGPTYWHRVVLNEIFVIPVDVGDQNAATINTPRINERHFCSFSSNVSTRRLTPHDMKYKGVNTIHLFLEHHSNSAFDFKM